MAYRPLKPAINANSISLSTSITVGDTRLIAVGLVALAVAAAVIEVLGVEKAFDLWRGLDPTAAAETGRLVPRERFVVGKVEVLPLVERGSPPGVARDDELGTVVAVTVAVIVESELFNHRCVLVTGALAETRPLASAERFVTGKNKVGGLVERSPSLRVARDGEASPVCSGERCAILRERRAMTGLVDGIGNGFGDGWQTKRSNLDEDDRSVNAGQSRTKGL